MTPIIFIVSVSLVLILMLYWILRDYEGGRRPLRNENTYQYETAQELFNYVEEDVYLGEDRIELLRPSLSQIQALWNLSHDKWIELCGITENKKRTREPFLRLYQASDLLRTFDMVLRHRSGRQDFDLRAGTACYFCIGYKEDGRFYPAFTSKTVMRQC